jgi:DNA-binding response OmpR family regulator
MQQAGSVHVTHSTYRDRPIVLADHPIVLVAEDDVMQRMMLVDALEAANFDVMSASTAEGAIGLLRTGQRVDLIITDVVLAGRLTGWDLASNSRDQDPTIPVIYVSGWPPEPDRVVDGAHFIAKPFDVANLVETVRDLLASRSTTH